METKTPDDAIEPKRGSRTAWFMIAVIIVLCIVSFVQGIILFKIKTERDGRSWPERLQRILPGLADKPRQATINYPDDRVVFWETTDNLEQIHDQINRLLRNMTTPFGSSTAGGPFPDIALKHQGGNHPATRPPASHDFNQLQQEIERIFEEACNASQPGSLLSRVNRGWDMVPSTAAMNIEDQGSNYVVTVALPGYDKQGITIRLEGRLLIIEAAQSSRGQTAATHHPPIMRQGQFRTQIMMPDNIEGAGAQAVLDHEMLRVQIPKITGTNSLVMPIAIR